ncbi:MAG: type I DNA topoisomerase [Clostridia bacterium]|nr:type I DNA topoisomerase [Clostridia bacterium]
MAKLVIVESPSKAKTIKKYLGEDYEVIASQGHIIDLPASKLAVDIENDFKPEYKTMTGKANIIKQIKELAKGKEIVYLATDPDREGEAIAWHLKNVLNIADNEKCRIEFNEITKNAVKKAVEKPRAVNLDLVDAQQARRILDRIVGYKLSPLLWKKVKKGTSAGRVQSVALKIIIDKEREIQNFKPEDYYLMYAKLQKNDDIVTAKFYGDINGRIELKDEEQVNKILKEIDKKKYKVVDIIKSERRKNPPAPFTTSSLQQEASRKLGFGVKKTMLIAQKLYESGHITYMRTDSIRLSDDAKKMAKDYITKNFGNSYYLAREFKAKDNAQDAHEAIRPTHVDNNLELGRDEEKLYNLILNRFLASQMSVAVYDTTKVKVNVEDYIFNINGSIIKFDGFMKLYIEGKDDKAKGKNDNDDDDDELNALPEFEMGEILKQKDLKADKKTTEPPARYTEASLVKVMEEKGVGRPSTYAPTISTIEDRLYIEKQGKYLVPTDLGTVVNKIMEENFENIVDVKFTADMENKLDMVAESKQNYVEMLRDFYVPFSKNLAEVQDKIEKVKIPEQESDVVCEKCGKTMIIKQGRFGKFLACPGYPDCQNIKPYNESIDAPCPDCGGKVIIKHTKTKRAFYVCENNNNTENSPCKYISWTKPKAKSKK